MKKQMLFGIIALLVTPVMLQAAVVVTNLVVAQREGTKLVDISYDVSCDWTNIVRVFLSVSNGTEVVNATSLTGDIGEGVATGTGNNIVWDMEAGWNGECSSAMVFVLAVSDEPLPEGMVAIPAGTSSGNNPLATNEAYNVSYPATYSLTVDLFFMDEREVSHDEMIRVMQWAYNNEKLIVSSYLFNAEGDGRELLDLDDSDCQIFFSNKKFWLWDDRYYPCVEVTGFGAKAYCNYRSEMEGRIPCYDLSDWSCNFSANGYRLPTGEEWEYAARGGLSEKRFSWGDTITHSQANYYSSDWFIYDTSSTRGYHPDYGVGDYPHTSPCGSFLMNNYGLYDMMGNVEEWCNDSPSDYDQMFRGGSWNGTPTYVRCGSFFWVDPFNSTDDRGFRAVCRSGAEAVSVSSESIQLDSRNYLLSNGTPLPNIGTNLYAWRASVACSVNAVAAEGVTNWICSGWIGSGNIPSSGEGSVTGTIILTNLDSSITWLWLPPAIDLWAGNVTAAQRPGSKLVEVSYDLHSTETNRADVFLTIFDPTNELSTASVAGDVGDGVLTGTARSAVWDAGADWDGNLDNLTFQVFGQDAQGAGAETPSGRVRISAGGNVGTDPDSGAYSLAASNSLFMDASEITKAQWDTVYDWAVTNDYTFANAGIGSASNHPVQSISWVDAAMWCNARSEMEGFVSCYNTNDWSCGFNANGYRLPTAEEWQYAARGGLSGKRFPWGDEITHSNANYVSSDSYVYDLSATRGPHPVYGGTAPESSGTTNGYGLYAMAGNVAEWCNDSTGTARVVANQSWQGQAPEVRCAAVSYASPSLVSTIVGFRTVQRASSSAFAVTGSDVPVDTRDYLLSVSSDHGTPVPTFGTNAFAWHASVTCSVESAVTSGLTNWTSAGWTGSGSIPPEGGTTNVDITLTGLVSSIMWNWDTNYWMENLTTGSGSTDPTSGWQRVGSNVQVQATASNGWLFMGWSGDASGDHTQGSIIVPMVRPVSVTATFSDDADDDGLLNTNETALGTDPRKKDSDGDGSDDPEELIAGTSPTNSLSVLAVDLAFESFANELSFFGVSGRYYQIEYSTISQPNPSVSTASASVTVPPTSNSGCPDGYITK